MKLIIGLLTGILAVSSFAASNVNPDLGKKVLISVGDFDNNYSVIWKKGICKKIFNLANQVAMNSVSVTCRELDVSKFLDSSLQNEKSNYDFHIRVLKSKKGTIGVDISNWKKTNDSDFEAVGWNLKDGEKTKVTKEDVFDRVIANFFYYASNQTAFRAGLLVNGVGESNKLKYDQKNGKFIEKDTGFPVSINRAYQIFEKESVRKKNYLRAGIEIGVALSAGLAGYYQNLAFNEVDFDYGFKDGMKSKFTGSGVKFDDNDKNSNYGHAYAGVMYFQAARTNGFTSLESFLAAFASSTVWELTEYREVLSINDEIITPMGGYIIGEAGYQVSCALLQKDNILGKALGYAMNPALAANHLIDHNKKDGKYAAQLDCKKPRWSEISAYIGLERGRKAYESKANNDMLVGLNATVINLENHGKAGTESKLIYDTAITKLIAEANSNDGLVDLKVIAQIVTAAYEKKKVGRDTNGELKGYDVILGIGSGSTWNDRGTTAEGKNEDFYGTIDILGATAHADVYYKGFIISTDIGFYGDFAMVKSYSLQKHKAANGGSLAGELAPIERHGYYWGLGTSTLASISIKKGRFEIGYRGQLSQASSINKRDRFSDASTLNTNYSDSYNTNRVYINYKITENVKIELAREFNFRSGSDSTGVQESGREDRYMATINYQF